MSLSCPAPNGRGSTHMKKGYNQKCDRVCLRNLQPLLQVQFRRHVHGCSCGGVWSRPFKGTQNCKTIAKRTTTKESMKAKFEEWGIDLQWVSLFPHINDFNGREPGHNFLGSVSRMVIDDNILGGLPVECLTMRQMTMAFCQQKVHEDTDQRVMCALKIYEVMWHWKNNPGGTKQNDGNIKAYANRIRNAETDDLFYKATHPNKCMYYSIFSTGQRLVAE